MVDILLFIAIVLTVFLGSALGRMILFIAPEETKPGKGWFRLLSAALLAGALFSGTSSFIIGILLAIAGFMVMAFSPERFLKDKLMRGFYTGILGLIMGVLLYTSPFRTITASFMFMFLMAYSALTFFPASKDVNLARYHVKRKAMYLKEIMLPLSTLFISVVLRLILGA